MNPSQASLTNLPAADPTALYQLRDGLYAVDLTGAALVGFDLFTHLHRQPSDLGALCRDLGLKERPADVMLTLFVAMNLLRRDQDAYHVTATAREFLVRDSPFFMGPYYAALKDRPVCQDYIRILREGPPANWGSFKDEKAWAQAMEQDDFAQSFTAAMDCRGRVLGPAMARAVSPEVTGARRLLDVAGGSGIYACCMVARHDHLQATVLEKPPVDRVAQRAIAAQGLDTRVAVAAGDMFRDAWPADHQVHLLSNVLHDWDVPVVRDLLRRSHDALPPGGCLLVHDAHLNEGKTGTLAVAAYSALLMHTTEGRCYSVGEMRTWLEAEGFRSVRHTPTALDRSVITARKA
jgi:hypothetical protein